MSPAEVATSYNRIAQRWAGAAFDHTNGLAAHRRALQFHRRAGAAIDVGCGCSGRVLDWLIAEGFEVEGLDLSSEMLRLARLRHPEVVFHQEDLCLWSPAKRYDFVSAWDSIWHVPLATQPMVIAKLCAALAPNGVLIFTTGGLDGPGETRDSHMGVPMYHATPGLPEILRIIATSGCVCRHLEYDQFPEMHVFLIVQKPAG